MAGKYRIVLISPEMLLSERFITNVLRKKEFSQRAYSVVVDEAHCVSHWGASFRKVYGRLGLIRVFLPRNTPMIAISATLTTRVAADVRKRLQFKNDYLFLNVGNDRTNVSLVVRSIHNKQDEYTDLRFVVPENVTDRESIPKTWIYVDNIPVGNEIVSYIEKLLPPELRDAVRPYNALLDPVTRSEAMRLFREGYIRILVCTDAAGMVSSRRTTDLRNECADGHLGM